MLPISFLVLMLIHACVGRHLLSAPHVSPGLRIINGKDAEPHVAPYSALIVLLTDGKESYCGGSLIHEQFVLTAASCLSDPNTEIDRVGLGLYNFNQSEPLQELQAAGRALHPAYAPSNATDHDLALVKLERPAVVVAGQVETVELPPAAAFPAARLAYDGRPGTLYGWGAVSDASTAIPRVLQTLEVRVQSWAQCQSADQASAREDGLCVGRADGLKGLTCRGDEGGPLLVGGLQVGVVGRHASASCAESPVTFVARVDYHVDWIKKTMGEL